MPINLGRLNQSFIVDTIEGYASNADLILNIRKNREYVAYKSHSSKENALIAYTTSGMINAYDNLTIADRSATLVENRVLIESEFLLVQSTSTITSDVDQVLITDVFTTETNTQNSLPLFFQHIISADHYDPNSGHKIISIKVLDENLSTVTSSEYLFDSTNGIFYNNFENYYKNKDNPWNTYYLQYTVKESDTEINVYTVLIDNKKIYSLAGIEHLTGSGTLDSASTAKVYLVETLSNGTFLFTMANSGTYALKKLKTNRIQVLAPVANTIEDPWYLRITNGKFFSTIAATTFKYHISEILSQTFSPYLPYRRAQGEPATFLNKNMLKLAYNNIYENSLEGIFIDLFIYDETGSFKYAITTNTELHGTIANNSPRVLYSSLQAGGTYGIRSVDHHSGFIDIKGITLKENWKYKCSYNYEYEDLPITEVNLNPIFNQDILGKTLILFLIPSLVDSDREQSVYYLIANENGRIIQSNWNGFSSFDASLKESGGSYLFYNNPPEWFTNKYGILNCTNFKTNYTVNGGNESYAFLVLAETQVVIGNSVENIDLIDIRQRGGGIIENHSPQADDVIGSCWDTGNWDGKAFPGHGAFLVEVPSTILKSSGGIFTSEEIKKIVSKHTAYGIYPVIRGYGIDPEITSIIPGDGAIELQWSHSSPTTWYKIFMSTEKDGTFSQVNSTPIQEDSTLNQYRITGLKNGQVYYIYIVGGTFIDNTWKGISGQVIGPGNTNGLEDTTLKMIKCIPGSPRNSNLLSNEFDVQSI